MTRAPPISLALVGLVLTMACGDVPTEAVNSDAPATPSWAKGEKGKKPRPPGQQEAIPVNWTFSDDPGDGVLSDAGLGCQACSSTYQDLADSNGDGEADVFAAIGGNGRPSLGFGAGSARTFRVDLSQVIWVDPEWSHLLPSDLGFFLTGVGSGWMNGLDPNEVGGLTGEPPATELTMSVVLTLNGEWWGKMRYGRPCESNAFVPGHPDLVQVEGESPSWTLTAESRPEDGNAFLCRPKPGKGKPRMLTVARVNAPFEVYLEALP